MRLLITAFQDFDGGWNSSERLLDALEAEAEAVGRDVGGRVAFARFPVDTEGISAALEQALDRAGATHLLMMGQATARDAIALEQVARNVRDLRVADAARRIGAFGPVAADGPDRRRATWPDMAGAAAAVAAAGVPAYVSGDAGAHLCNQALYLALGRPTLRAMFLHLPLCAEQVADGLPAALRRPGAVGMGLAEMMRAVRLILRHTRASAQTSPPPSKDRRMSLPRRSWIEMTTEDFASGDPGSWIAVLPVAAVEQHGPHLPVGVDAMLGQGYLDRALGLIPNNLPVTVLPMQLIGTSHEHLAYPGTLSLSPETVIRAWTEIGVSVARAGVRRLVLLNSHGGNTSVLDIVARSLRVSHGLLAVTTSWHRLGYPKDLFSADELRNGIHAGEIETSVMRALSPDLVRMEHAGDFASDAYAMERDYVQLRAATPAGFGWMAQDLHPSGAIGNAAAGTAEAGEAALDHGARAFVELLRDVARFPLDQLRAGPLTV